MAERGEQGGDAIGASLRSVHGGAGQVHDPAGLGRGGRGEGTPGGRPLLLQHGRRVPLARQRQLGGKAGRERPGRPHRHAARSRSGQHDRLEERREAGGDAGGGAEWSVLLGGLDDQSRRQCTHRVGTAAGAAKPAHEHETLV